MTLLSQASETPPVLLVRMKIDIKNPEFFYQRFESVLATCYPNILTQDFQHQ